MITTSVDMHRPMTNRRWLLKRLLTVGGVSLTSTTVWSNLWGAETTIRPVDSSFMEKAISMKRAAVEAGDQPYGAVIVKNGQIVGEGPSRVVTDGDPTAHAEMEAIRDAAKRMGTRDLSGCIIYATSRPCRMCETACYWAKLSRIYFSAAVSDGGTPSYSSC